MLATQEQQVAWSKSGYHRVLLRDNFTCQYCGLFAGADADTYYHARLCVDHIIPVRHFSEVTGQNTGLNDDDNLVTACFACNHSKSSARCRTLAEAKQLWAEKYAAAGHWFNQHAAPNRTLPPPIPGHGDIDSPT